MKITSLRHYLDAFVAAIILAVVYQLRFAYAREFNKLNISY